VGETAVVGGIDGSVTAVDVATGDEAWTAEVGGFLEAPIAATDRLVLVPRRGDKDTPAALLALAVDDGEEVWRYEPLTASYAVGSPSVDEDAAYVAFADGTVRAVALADGSERWDASLNTYVNPFSPAAAPVVVDGGVVVADVRGQVYRLDAATGERVWDHAYNHPVLRSAPVASGEHVVLGTADGSLAAFDPSSGDLVWSADLGDAPLRSLAVAGDRIVVVRGGAAAGLAAFEHDPSAALVRVQSPTILRPSALALGWAAGLVAAALLFGAGRALWARLGPHEIPSPGDDGSDEEEP
jgi:outer membrane protein assembly factor BamB